MATMTAALAIVKQQGTAVAKIRSLRVTENVSRGTVRGIGRLTREEVPAVAIDCTASFEFYNVDLNQTTIPKVYPRAVNTLKDFTDNILLQDGVQVEIYKKVEDFIDPVTKLKKAKPEIFATIQDLFIDSDGFDITEGQVSNKTQSFQYLTPILIQE